MFIDIERVRTMNTNEYICPICFGLVWQARLCSLCKNIFCQKCIQQSLEKTSITCPLCRRDYQEKFPSIQIQNYLSNLQISCQNLAFGCKEILLYDNLNQHQTQSCQYLTKECSICNDLILENDFIQHELSCQPLYIQCQICLETIHRQVFDQHYQQNHTNLFDDYSLFEINFSDTIFIEFNDINLFKQFRKIH